MVKFRVASFKYTPLSHTLKFVGTRYLSLVYTYSSAAARGVICEDDILQATNYIAFISTSVNGSLYVIHFIVDYSG